MPNIFGHMSREQKRKFKKLSPDGKVEYAQASIASTVSDVMTQKISDGIITGIRFERNRIYQEYVVSIDESKTEKEKMEHIERLLSFLRVNHLNYVKREREQQEGERR